MEQIRIKNIDEKRLLARKYNAAMDWDTLNTYTCALQEKFIDNNRPISFNGKIIDIVKMDTIFYLKLHYITSRSRWNNDHTCIALVSVNSNQFIVLKSVLNSGNHSDKGCFVFQVKEIIPINPSINSDIGQDDMGYCYTYFVYNFEKSLLIFKGSLISYYLDEIVNESYE